MEAAVHQSVGAIIIDGDDYVLQIRDNKDGVLWPGKIHYWGGAVEPEDESNPEKAILRELKEELDIDPGDINLEPFHVLSVPYIGMNQSPGDLLVDLYEVRMVARRALHVYEGTSAFRLRKDFAEFELDGLEITAYAKEALLVHREYAKFND